MGEPDPTESLRRRISIASTTTREWPSLRPDRNRTEIGDKENQVCRFCRRSKPEVSFRSDAHAIPESLGNKSLFTNSECDRCNQFFGRGIENDFGTWSNINRTFAGISGKRGVPGLKWAGGRVENEVENESDHIRIKQDDNAPDYVLDEEKKQFRFDIERGTYTPVAVLKTFVRIGLTLMPPEEVPNFSEALDWIQEEDHTKSRVEKCPVIQTSLPLPGIKLDRAHVILLIRKAAVMGVPYAFLVLGYGYDMFQVCLPSLQDRSIYGRNLTLPAFPILGIDPALYEKVRVRVEELDLCGREKVKGEQVPIQVSFSQIRIRD